MELRDFVRDSLVQLMCGITDAQNELMKSNGASGVVNPIWNDQKNLNNHTQLVNFDIAVTASDQTTTGGHGGIKVWSVEIGGKLETLGVQSSVSRIAFSVPVLPSAITVQGVGPGPSSPLPVLPNLGVV